MPGARAIVSAALVGSYDCALGRISRIRMPRGVLQF